MKTRAAIVALGATALIATTGGATTQAATMSQRNAEASAKEYLQFEPFSKYGLIHQLSSPYGDGYSRATARYAVNHIRVNWYHQALRSARQYLHNQPFSRRGLIQQLSSRYGEGFTLSQARYAANKVYR